jgi:lysophospholipase L1-like esterase
MSRGLLRVLRGGLIIVVAALLSVEIALQAASLLMPDRSTPRRSGARFTILCVGDSHTYGAGVRPAEAYPDHLERLLDEQAPGRYSVVNVGVPGMNTAQVLDRLPDQVRQYRPDMILAWVGINNSSNRARARVAPGGFLAWLDWLAGHLRTYRLARVWLNDRRLDRDRTAYAGGRVWEIVDVENLLTGRDRLTLRRSDGVIETIQHEGDARSSTGTEWQLGTEQGYEAIIRHARATGVPIAFIGYPLGDIGVGGIANRALRKVTSAHGVPLIESAESVKRIPPEERNFLWAAHPDGRMYGEIARDVLPVVLRYRPPASEVGTGQRPGPS